MVNRYPMDVQVNSTEQNITPSSALVQQILNYSRSVEPKKLKHKKVLVHLN